MTDCPVCGSSFDSEKFRECIDQLPSGEVEFIDSEIEEFEKDFMEVMIRPQASREVFISEMEESGFDVFDKVATESLIGTIPAEWIDAMIEKQVVEAIELNRPLEFGI